MTRTVPVGIYLIALAPGIAIGFGSERRPQEKVIEMALNTSQLSWKIPGLAVRNPNMIAATHF